MHLYRQGIMISDYKKEIPNMIAKGELDVIIVNDVHIPFHDEKTVNNVLSFIAEHKPKTVFLNGDIIDFYSVSRYEKDPARITSLQSDLDMLDAFLEGVRFSAPGADIYYVEGNHEHRLINWLWSHPEIANLRSLRTENVLNLSKHNIKWIPQDKTFEYKGVIVTHGTAVRKRGGMSAHGEIEKYGKSGISGHTHRAATVSQTTYNGTHTWIENGCLCEMEPGYVKHPDWQQAITVGHVYNGKLSLNLLTIKDHNIFPL